MEAIISIGFPLNVSGTNINGKCVHVTFNHSEIRNMKLFQSPL